MFMFHNKDWVSMCKIPCKITICVPACDLDLKKKT